MPVEGGQAQIAGHGPAEQEHGGGERASRGDPSRASRRAGARGHREHQPRRRLRQGETARRTPPSTRATASPAAGPAGSRLQRIAQRLEALLADALDVAQLARATGTRRARCGTRRCAAPASGRFRRSGRAARRWRRRGSSFGDPGGAGGGRSREPGRCPRNGGWPRRSSHAARSPAGRPPAGPRGSRPRGRPAARGPPARSSASATREPSGRRRRSGCRTAPATWT